ncbi:MAG: enoyl-CoA hydratase-related protein [Bacteroidetes bacterium]|nr:enoyl-CoA hydratase-related protein [Bacteroidota bacterium]
MKDFKNIKVEYFERVAVLTINRPAVLNALNSEVFRDLNNFLDDLEKETETRVLIITGEGRAFIAGADIAEMSELKPEEALKFSQIGQDTFARLENLPIPVIAAINGYALGGGCELAMACDFRIASKNAKFGQPELNLGLIPGYAGTQRLTKLTGLGNALFMILTTETIPADEALRIGLVQKVVEPEALMTDVLAMAKKIASNGSMAAATAKKVIRKGFELKFGDSCLLEAESFAELFSYDSTKEGMKAFLEKRKPNW